MFLIWYLFLIIIKLGSLCYLDKVLKILCNFPLWRNLGEDLLPGCSGEKASPSSFQFSIHVGSTTRFRADHPLPHCPSPGYRSVITPVYLFVSILVTWPACLYFWTHTFLPVSLASPLRMTVSQRNNAQQASFHSSLETFQFI